MNRPLSRRLFMKALPAAPLAAKSAAEGIAAEAGVSVVGSAAGMLNQCVPTSVGSGNESDLRLLGLKKAGMLPDWFIKQRRRGAKYNSRILDPDIAALRSVSVASKVSMQAERNFHRGLSEWEDDVIDQDVIGRFYGWIK